MLFSYQHCVPQNGNYITIHDSYFHIKLSNDMIMNIIIDYSRFL